MDNLQDLDLNELFDDETKSELDNFLAQTNDLMGGWEFDPSSGVVKLKVKFIKVCNICI